jgi:drug/metabolite transporter (DMT)-like permease
VLESRRHSRATNHAGKSLQYSAGRELHNGDYIKFAVIGLTLFAGMATQQVGLLTTSVTNSGFLTGLYVVFTPILAVLLYRNMPHPVTWLAALLSLMGIYFLSGGDLGQLVKGDLLTIFSAMFWGLQVVLIARFVGESGRPLALSQVQFTITAVLALLVALVIEPIEWGGILEVAPQILYAGIFASGFAFTIQVIGQRYTSAPQAAIFLSAEAPFAALFAFIFLDEKISSIGFLGCVLILAAMLAVELVPQWQAHRANRVSEH